jgi:phage-related protein
MAEVAVIFYAEAGRAPALEWMARQPEKVRDKFDFLFGQLQTKGGRLSRPHAAPLRDKIYELRVRHKTVNYRLLYFFHENVSAVLAHGCTKEAAVDDADIDRAIARRTKFMSNPAKHTFEADDEADE